MERKKVTSSNLASIGYELSSGTLEVEFNHGGIYQYFDVPERKYDGLMRASSHGGYFDAEIKKAGYKYKKVG